MLVDISEVVERVKELRRSPPGTVLVAIDGAGGSEKSTLAASIARQIDDAYVICLDDFARPSMPGWDQERFQRQVLDPLLAGQNAYYQRWDWPTHAGQNGTAYPATAPSSSKVCYPRGESWVTPGGRSPRGFARTARSARTGRQLRHTGPDPAPSRPAARPHAKQRHGRTATRRPRDRAKVTKSDL